MEKKQNGEIFKLVFFRGKEEDFDDEVYIMGGLPEPDLVAQIPEEIYDKLFNSLYELQEIQKREKNKKV